MNIIIKNYNGIKSLDYTLEDGKINFLFGISGAGKSSIASALSDSDKAEHIRVGEDIKDLLVEINGDSLNQFKFKVFNMEYMKDVLIDKIKGTDIYSILIGDGGRINQCKNDYQNAIQSLIDVKKEIVNILTNLNILVKDLKLATIKNGSDFSSKSLNIIMKNNADKTPNYRNAITYNTAQIKWMKDGASMAAYSKMICPFCTKKLSTSRIKKINELLVFDSKTYEKINSESGIFSALNINEPDWKKKREVNSFNKKLLDYMSIKTELETINSYIDIASSIDIVNINIEAKKPSSKLKEMYPNIVNAIEQFNKEISHVKSSLGKLKAETMRVISQNSDVINKKLDLLGIPYRFIRKEIDEKNNSAFYNIYHVEDKSQKDRVNCLSFGEKNLIGLLLFMLANKDADGIIIDDPASSFDEYRRKIIFDLIYDFHKASTVLILSHDPIFAKYAIFHKTDSSDLYKKRKSMSELKKKFLNDTGKIDFMESYDDCVIKKINFENFGSLQNFVKDRLKNLSRIINYQTAINIRILFELDKKNNPIVYGYLSAIIHKVDYDEIINQLVIKGKAEKDVLDIINESTGFKYEPLSPNYKDDIDSYTYLDFEKIVKCRELLNSRVKKEKVIKDELSNIIHMNSAQAICLNPYEFNYFSKYVKEYIDK